MKTTELFVEQVLIGFLVLFSGGLLVSKKLLESIFSANLGEAAALVGAAYLLGIVYDRFADTLLQDLEQHHRLWYGLKSLKRNPYWHGDAPKKDPFPEHEYRMRILHNNTASDYAHYLRSRIRLTRALTTVIPGLSVGLLLVSVKEESPTAWLQTTAVLLVVIFYGLGFMTKMTKNEKIRGYKPPKTYDLANAEKYEDYRSRIGFILDLNGTTGSSLWYLLRNDRISLCVLLLAAGATALALAVKQWWLMVFPLGGILVTGFFGWTWWRISQTFLQFLDDYDRFSVGRGSL